jgi:hypothetical protein
MVKTNPWVYIAIIPVSISLIITHVYAKRLLAEQHAHRYEVRYDKK